MNEEWRDPQEILTFLKEEPFIDIKTDKGIHKKVIPCNFQGTPCIPFKYHWFLYYKEIGSLCPDQNDVKKFVDHDGSPREEVLGWKFAKI